MLNIFFTGSDHRMIRERCQDKRSNQRAYARNEWRNSCCWRDELTNLQIWNRTNHWEEESKKIRWFCKRLFIIFFGSLVAFVSICSSNTINRQIPKFLINTRPFRILIEPIVRQQTTAAIFTKNLFHVDNIQTELVYWPNSSLHNY